MKLFYMALLAALALLGWLVTVIITYQTLVDNGFPDAASAIMCVLVGTVGSIGLAMTAIISIDKEDRTR